MNTPYTYYLIAGLFILGAVLIIGSVIRRVHEKRTEKKSELKNNYFGG